MPTDGPALGRRQLLTLGVLLGAGTMSADLDYSRPERELIALALDEIETTWEHAEPLANVAALGQVERRIQTIGTGDRDMLGLHARQMVMSADAEAAAGRPEAAARTAFHARRAAEQLGNRVLQAAAETIEGELYAGAAPRGQAPIEMLARARERAGTTPTGVQAAALLANAMAARGDSADNVMRVLAAAETVQERLPATTGSHWTAGHLYSFGGSALVQAGAHGQAGEWLTTADGLLDGLPGIRAATTLYWGHGAAKADDWDAAYSYAATALAIAPGQRPPAWLSGGIARLAGAARGRGGDWHGLRVMAGV